MNETAERFKQIEELCNFAVEMFVNENVIKRNNELIINAEALRDNKNAQIILFEILRDYHFNFDTIKNILACDINSSGKLFETDDYQLIQTADKSHSLLSSLLGVLKPKPAPLKVSSLKSQFCNKFSHLPLAYYGNPTKICSH